ncbi:hypothetical protein JAAARDRAFT_73829 [Jaapia argillacea MUCL 33604]|uniref:EF-hand domain-containing protein n=1 Tax=Jaapia argillacea MUCL 33604 TaxID=933084 RepID=A0A067PJH6_9AGAM|nr:hypothetical protein JAAARDRAFT_73829 [Jaapia argillacea MUCL 33604]
MAGRPQYYDAVELQNQEHGRGTPGMPSRYSGDVSPPGYTPPPGSTPYDLEGGPRDLKHNLYDAPPDHRSRSSTYSLLKKVEQDFDGFDPRKASQSHLTYAEGDMPNDKFSKFYNYLLNVSIITRWFLFIVPVLGIIWIPGILQLTTWHDSNLWGVGWMWWSSWLTCSWGGWWAALAAAKILPKLFRATIGLVAVGTRKYTHWMLELERFNALLAWSVGIWIAFSPLILVHQVHPASTQNASTLSIIGKVLCGLTLSSALLLFEKIFVQFIATMFHERSSAERIESLKQAMKILTRLYTYSKDISHIEALPDGPTKVESKPKVLFQKAMKGVRDAATTTTTVLGNVASEIAGTRMLQPNSPEAKVKTALESSDGSLWLARRLFYSFVKQPVTKDTFLVVQDIIPFFKTQTDAAEAFAFFDKDANGNVSRDEVDLACLESHREQIAIEHSKRDLKNAVGRLDSLLMFGWGLGSTLIFALLLDMAALKLFTTWGATLLALNWLFGGSLSEILISVIFLLVKHPFDVGDRVDLPEGSYTVKEILLLSTIFLDSNGTFVQVPNAILNTKYIQNIRRSPHMSEPFKFDIDFGTPFDQLENLRDKMITFLKANSRDFFPVFDIVIMDIPDQKKMSLKVDIKYKSNLQLDAVKVKRRNKWICALMQALTECEVYGPSGGPSPPSVSRYTAVPWENVEATDLKKKEKDEAEASAPKKVMPEGGWRLTGHNAVAADASADVAVFGDAQELRESKADARTAALLSRSTTASSIPSVSTRSSLPPLTTSPSSSTDEPEVSTPKVPLFTRSQR